MFKYPLFLLITVVITVSAYGQDFAPGAYLPPLSAKDIQQSWDQPLRQHDLARYLWFPAKTTTLTVFAGQNDVLKSREQSNNKVLDIAEGFEVEYTEKELFGPPLAEGTWYTYRGTISSMDAQALRFRVDLSMLREGEELYLIDPVLPRAFGPYTADDAAENGCWLATTEGEWAMVLLRTPHDSAPALRLTNVAHFYRGFSEFLKQLECNINIACEDNPDILDVASGVGMLVVPSYNGDQGLCTCTLINNDDTPEKEPYALTSNHCIPEVVSANEADVIWDYRATACDTHDPPPLSSLPRSNGTTLLSTSSDLDITLMELDSVPNGAYGRFYTGWTTRLVSAGEAITGIHHPRASHMRISYGTIRKSRVSGLLYSNQIEVLWSDGVTEPGSSGLGLLLDADGFPIIGTLSNGPLHTCGASDNTDRFSSFRLFFPQVKGWLTGTDKPDPDDPNGPCPLEIVYTNNSKTLQRLRDMRDRVLMKTPLGRKLVEAYYDMAPALAERIENDPQTAAAFRAATLPMVNAMEALSYGE
ncbi:MAG: serine protease [Candidatus Hydrogenedentota bacterium]